MNDERLYVNGEQVDLKISSPLAYTLQVNDIGDVANRQTSFTRSIDIPTTPTNIKIFDYLGVIGNTSTVPYVKLVIDYYVGNDCIIFNGWGNLTESNDLSYKLYIYDGIIDLYKAIENKSMAELATSDLTHIKDLSTVTNTWNTNLNYKYILADYNGLVKYDGTKYNIDYLVPSAKVSYLWNKIFDTFNMTYEGSIFQSEDFTNLWMTYPKGIEQFGAEILIYENGNTRFDQLPNTYSGNHALYFYKDGNPSTDLLVTTINSKHFKVAESSSYKLELTGGIIPIGNTNELAGVRCDIWIAKNVSSISNPNNISPSSLTLLKANIGGDYLTIYDSASSKIINLSANDTISLIIKENDGRNLRYVTEQSSNPLRLKITKIAGGDVDFSQTLIDFKIKDFINEIVNRFSLTIFKDKYTNNYKFLTLDERITSAEIIDWSKKFQVKKSEKYVYNDYAQLNRLKYKYNDENSDFYDGFINIQNQNLADEKILIESKIYAPEKELNTTDLPFESHIYKLWDKEVSENDGSQQVQYKNLDKRFYFLKSETTTFSPSIIVGSQNLASQTTVTSAPIESYSGVSYSDVVTNYYPSISNILTRAKVLTCSFNLSSTDIADFDFAKLYYIDELGGYFIINKISNWQPTKLTDVEIIKVENDLLNPIDGNENGYDTSDGLEPYITITNYTIQNIDTWNRNITINFITNITSTYLKAPGLGFIPNTSPYVFMDSINPFGGVETFLLTSLDDVTVSNSVWWWG
jgi:hypothetical protein